jgi:formylglycine-generating enzyme required for sulfatase activity
VPSNGSVIWDFGGNVWNWTDARCDTTNWYSVNAIYEWSDANLTDWEKYVSGPSGALTSANGAGKYYACVASGNAMLRGGAWAHGNGAGVFSADLLELPTLVHAHIGFRCAYGNEH